MIKSFIKHITTFAGLILLFLGQGIFGQTPIIRKDSSHIEVTYFKEQLKERYSGDDFNYSINDTGGINLLQRIFSTFFDWLGDLFGFDIDVDYKTLEYIVYSCLAVIVLYLLLKFLLENPVSTVFKTENKTLDGFSYVEEDIEQVDFSKLIKSAQKEENYRLATRYLYLKCLKEMANNNTIEWHYDKTNLDYLNEIKDAKLQALFKRISYIYDYVWYGEFPVDAERFKENKADFNALTTALKRG